MLPPEANLQAWLEAEPHPAAWVTTDGHYRALNQAMRRALRLASDESPAHPRAVLLRRNLLPRLAEPDDFVAYLSRLDAGETAEVHLELLDDGPPPRTWEYRNRPVLDATGEPMGWRETLLDVTDAEQRVAWLEAEAQAAGQRQAEAESLLQHKTDTLARISHELRTPLTAILGFCQVLLRYTGEMSEVQSDYVHKLLRNATVLLQLLNNILDIARIERGAVTPTWEVIELATLIGEAVEVVEPLLWGKELSLGLDVQPDLPAIVSDRLKLKQMLINLLSNAAKYTMAGRVDLYAQEHEGGVQVQVVDTGIGIAEEELERIFEPYIQIRDHRRPIHEPSTGLGLAICRVLAEMLYGTLTVASEVDVGSSFTLWLPVEVPEQSPT